MVPANIETLVIDDCVDVSGLVLNRNISVSFEVDNSELFITSAPDTFLLPINIFCLISLFEGLFESIPIYSMDEVPDVCLKTEFAQTENTASLILFGVISFDVLSGSSCNTLRISDFL